MFKKKVLFLCFAFLIFTVLPGYSAVNNIRISGDITTQAVTRDLSFGLQGTKLLPLGTSNQVKDSEDFLLTQMRLRFDADLTDNVEATVRLLNERLWGEETSSNSDIDLDLGYITLKEFLSPNLTLKIGRQNLRFGNAFIVGDPDTNVDVSSASALHHIADDLSLRKSFDAVRATLDLEPFTIDLVYALVNEGSTNVNEDRALYGLNINYSPDEHYTLEGYIFSKYKAEDFYYSSLSSSPPVLREDNKNYVYTAGGRVKKDINEHLTLNFEAAHQFGDYLDGSGRHSKRDAWGGQVGLDYKFLNKTYSILGFWYTYLSGDGDEYSSTAGTAGAKYTGWDPMFEDQTGGEIINLILPHTNSHTINLYYFTYLRKDINLLVKYTYESLAENYFNSRYAIAKGPAYGNYYYLERDKKHLGDEVDLKLTYDYSENAKFILAGGIVFPGPALAEQNDNLAYSLRLVWKVNF